MLRRTSRLRFLYPCEKLTRNGKFTGLRSLSMTAHQLSNSSLQPVAPPVFSTSPSDSFQLLSDQEKTGQAEDILFDAAVEQVQEWWDTRRYAGIKRPYSAADVVSKRGALQQTYPSSLMARKLFNLLVDRAAQGEPVHTSASRTDRSSALRRQSLI